MEGDPSVPTCTKKLNTDRVNDAKGYWASRDCFSCYSCCYTRGYTYPIDNQCYFDSYSPDSCEF